MSTRREWLCNEKQFTYRIVDKSISNYICTTNNKKLYEWDVVRYKQFLGVLRRYSGVGYIQYCDIIINRNPSSPKSVCFKWLYDDIKLDSILVDDLHLIGNVYQLETLNL